MKPQAITEPGLTRQRDAVLRVLRESHDHPTASDVFARAKEVLPTISFATVYNSLRFLKEAGHISEIHFGDGATRFDAMTKRHDHAMCTSCGKLVDIEMDVPGEIIKLAAKHSKFQPHSLQFTLRGLCPDCVEPS